MRLLSTLCLPALATGFLLPLKAPSTSNQVARVQGSAASVRGLSRGSVFPLYAGRKPSKPGKKAKLPVTVKHVDEEEPQFLIINDGAGRTINTTAETYVTRGDKEYMISCPIDTPIVLINEEEEEIDLDDPRMPQLYSLVEGRLAELGARIQKTAGVLTIEGKVELFDEEEGEEFDEDDDELEEELLEDENVKAWAGKVETGQPDRTPVAVDGKDDDEQFYDFDSRDDPEDYDDEEDMGDLVEPITDVTLDGETFTVVAFVEPYFIVSKKDGESWKIVSDDTANKVFDLVLDHDLESEFEAIEEDTRRNGGGST